MGCLIMDTGYWMLVLPKMRWTLEKNKNSFAIAGLKSAKRLGVYLESKFSDKTVGNRFLLLPTTNDRFQFSCHLQMTDFNFLVIWSRLRRPRASCLLEEIPPRSSSE